MDIIKTGAEKLSHYLPSSLMTFGSSPTRENGDAEPKESLATTLEDLVNMYPLHSTMLALSLGSQLYKIGRRLYDRVIWSGTILELEMERMVLVERPLEPSLWETISASTTTAVEVVHYHDIVQSLELAARDSRVVGLIVTMGSGALLEQQSVSHLAEIRDAVVKFRSEKRFTIAHADSIGEFSAALRTYWFASACEHIMVSATGMVTIPPMISSGIFFKHTLKMLDIDAYVCKKDEFKTAGNIFTEDKFTEQHREQVTKLIDAMQERMVRDIAASRGVNEDAVSQWINNTSSMTPQQAVDLRVIDTLGTLEDAYDQAVEGVGRTHRSTSFLFSSSYLRKRGKPYESGKQGIAIVYAEGPITYGEYQNPLMGSIIQGSVVARMLRGARKDKKVRVIIIRVNSPGGSAIGSDQIAREIELCKRDGKKVIVSMGGVAASGGYWISCNADAIVCESMCITGSIGVVFTKFHMRELFAKKLGITFDSYMTSDAAKRFSSLFPVDADQRKVVQEEIDHLYVMFKEFVSRTRKIDVERMSDIAGGRVYLAEEAKQLQLVDQVGGLSVAIELAKDMAGFTAKDRVRLVKYPKRKSVLAMIAASVRPTDNREQRDRRLVGVAAAAAAATPSFYGASLLAQMFNNSPVMNLCYTAFSMITGALQLPNLGSAVHQPPLSLRSSVDTSVIH